MRVIKDGKINTVKSTVALGNFDGIHMAHRAVIDNCIQNAKKENGESCVFLFSEHTLNVLGRGNTELLTDWEEKLEILEELGVDCVYTADFTEIVRSMSPDGFIKMLTEKINVSAISVGYDYRFGYNAEGDTDVLRKLGEKYGFSVLVNDEMKIMDKTVKSTAIRRLVAEGETGEAQKYLGRAYSISGDVVKGFQNGRKIGIPTANVQYSKDKLLPKNGVYAGYTIVDGKYYKSVINVGANPTFCAERVTVESHLLGFDRNIYGKRIRVEFVTRIRDERKFGSPEELKGQIKKDIMTAEQLPKKEGQ